jgi:hypothetical protein
MKSAGAAQGAATRCAQAAGHDASALITCLASHGIKLGTSPKIASCMQSVKNASDFEACLENAGG